VQPGCRGRHAVRVQELLGGADVSINLITAEDHGMEEDEDLYVNIARVEQEEDDWQELDDSWLELDGGESGEEAGVYCPSACLRKDDSGLEEELEYFHDVTPPPEEEGVEEDRWWSPEPQRPGSKEEDEEENQYLVGLLMSEPESKNNSSEPARLQAKAARAPSGGGHQVPEGKPEEEERDPRGNPCSGGPPARKKPRRRGLRKRKMSGQREEWETARRDAWLRELLTDSSEGEPEVEYTKFEESSRWIAEMTGSRDRGQCEPDAEEINEVWM
jgi:hypothetical protein